MSTVKRERWHGGIIEKARQATHVGPDFDIDFGGAGGSGVVCGIPGEPVFPGACADGGAKASAGIWGQLYGTGRNPDSAGYVVSKGGLYPRQSGNSPGN